jgi:hypothetical protein
MSAFSMVSARCSPARSEQFVDLNEKIGGVEIDNNIVPQRTAADPTAIARLHRGGFINDFKYVNLVAILDQRPPEAEDLPSHTQFHTWVTRAGLVAAHGHADNHVAWMVPGVPTATTPLEAALVAMDRWLAAIDADTSDRSQAEKIVVNKPAGLLDGIYDARGNRSGDIPDCHRLYPSYGDARTVAACGDLRVQRIAKAQLKPLNRSDYPGIAFTEEQWRRLLAVFPRA